MSFVVGLLLLLSPPARAQQLPDRQWAIFRETAGLLSSDVYAILATGDAVWFGVDQGISRYDGRWHSFDLSTILQNKTSRRPLAAIGRVTALANGTDLSTIWAGTDQGNLLRWDGEAWTPVLAVASPVQVLAAVDKQLWIGTNAGLLILDNGELQAVPQFADHPVAALAAAGDAVWIGTEQGLWRSSRDGSGLAPVALEGEGIKLTGPIQALWADGTGNLWVGVDGYVARYRPDTHRTTPYEIVSGEGDSPPVTAISADDNGSIWISTAGGGVVQYQFDNEVQISAIDLTSATKGGLASNTVRGLAVDQDGSIWFATPVGVSRYQGWAWLEIDDAVAGLVVRDLLWDSASGLWVATEGEGVEFRRGIYARPDSYLPDETALPSALVYDLAQDATGAIWAATAGGVGRFAAGEWTAPMARGALPSPDVRKLAVDGEGLWLATAAGLARYTFATAAVHSDPLFTGRAVTTLAYDTLKRLWVATEEGGIWLRTPEGQWLDSTAISNGAPAGAGVTALLADPATPGAMWAAFTAHGIFHWDGNGWRNVDHGKMMRGDQTAVLAPGPTAGGLWIGSDVGISYLDAISFDTFETSDGAENGAVYAIAPGPTGAFWFGGPKGITYYRPETTPPQLELTGVHSVGGQPWLDSWQVLAGRQVGIDLLIGDLQRQPAQLHTFYRIRQAGSDPAWEEIPTDLVRLTFDEPGDYAVEFMVRDPAFNYSAPVTQKLTVLPPPALITVPILGEVAQRVFQLLLFFGSVALVGFSYVAYEVAHHRRRVTEAVRRGYNPYISGEPVRREGMFFGRHELLERIVGTLHNNSIMIHGERRIGKTSLLLQLANVLRQVKDNEYWFVPVYIDLEGTTEERLFHLLSEEITHVVAALPALSPGAQETLDTLLFQQLDSTGYSDRAFARDLRTLIRLLEEYGAQNKPGRSVRLILLMDEMDTLSHFDHVYQQQLRRIFMRDFASTVGAVVAGIQISKEWDRIESPWFNLFNEVAMQPFTRAEAMQLLIEPVRGYYTFKPAAVEFILDVSGGRPFRLQQYALEAVTHMLAARRRQITLADVQAADEILRLAEVAGHPQGNEAGHRPSGELSGPAPLPGSPLATAGRAS